MLNLCRDGVWKGNCSVPKVYRNLIEYKYFVKIKGEKLGEFEDLVGEGNRYLSNLPEGELHYKNIFI